MPEDNPAARPKRRQFSADYKLAILEEYERITEDGGKGALLRREGLYSSHIVEWQRAREVGALVGLTAPKHRKKRSAAERELDLLRRRNAKLEDQLAQHRRRSRPREKHRSSWRSCWRRALRRRTSSPRGADAVIDECFAVIEPLLGTKTACAAVGRSRATHYRRRQRPDGYRAESPGPRRPTS